MTINVSRKKEVQKVNTPTNQNNITASMHQTTPVFAFENGVPMDKFITTPIWSENTRAVLHNAVEYTGIKDYSPTALKDNNIAVQRSRTHLFDLIKYYEGDKRYFYEAYTTPYKDIGGHLTTGFGETKNIGNRTQEQAYTNLCNLLKDGSDELRGYLNKKVGKDAYDKLPASVKEGLLDLWFNKGLPGISDKGKALINALKENDYSTVVKELSYVYYIDKNTKKKIETEGLYRRSLNRMILASRDLTGTERTEALKEIDDFYNISVKKYQQKGLDITELTNIKNGKVENPKSAETYYELTIGEEFKGKGTFALIESTYKTLCDTTGTAEEKAKKKAEFKTRFMELNDNPKSIVIGQTYKIPIMKNMQNNIEKVREQNLGIDSTEIISETTDSVALISNTLDTENDSDSSGSVLGTLATLVGTTSLGIYAGLKKGGKKAAIIGAVVGGAAGIVLTYKTIKSGIKNLWNNIFGNKKDNSAPKTGFQHMLKDKNTVINEDGDFKIVTTSYTVPKGDNLYRISKKYDISLKTIKNDNNIADENIINEGQVLKITKLGYQVKKDEKMSDVAKKMGVSEEILKDINAMEEDEELKEGQIIEIPGYIRYVEPGETLYKISKEVGVTVDKLKEINGLTSNTIYPYDWKTGKGSIIKVVFDNSDFDVPDSMKKVSVDNETKTTTTLTNVSQKYKKDFERDDILPETRKFLENKRRINGRVAASKAVLTSSDFFGSKIPAISDKLKGKTIIVNAGHGYKESAIDRGAPAIGDINDEWILNTNNSVRLAKQLVANGAKVILLQGVEKGTPLISNEIKKKENKADLFISVHVNAFEGKTQDRTQIWFSNMKERPNRKGSIDSKGNQTAINKKSEALAKSIEAKFDQWIPQHENINSKDKFLVKGNQDYAQLNKEPLQVCTTAETTQNIPAVLWEVAFMAAPKGRERLKNETLMNDYAKVMTESIIKYFN